MMNNYIGYILSLNEKFAYSLIGKLRSIVIPLSNCCLKTKEIAVRKKLSENILVLKNLLTKILPEVQTEDIFHILKNNEYQFIIKEADKILNHEFCILSKKIRFPYSIDWHIDFNSGYRWSKGKIYHKYNQVDLNNNADIKFPRELSRCHHFLTLGEAYLLSKDEKYTIEFIEQISDWIKENPYKRSINWGCSMDIAIRSSNWIYSLRMFRDSKLIDDDFLIDFFSSLYLHARFIYENPEKNRVYNHNHYLSDLAGLILLSLLFEDINNEEVKQWKKNSLYELFREIRLQILPSGFSYERTTNYHRLVTELISYTIIILKNNQIEIPQDIRYRVKKMFEVVLHYTYENGYAPIIGDQDSGRFLPFYGYNINYQKYLLNIASVLFNDGIFKYYSGESRIDILFLFGMQGVIKFNEIQEENKVLNSKSFSDAGFYIMRSKNVYLFINNSGLSHYNEIEGGTHTHSDLLSFVYTYNNISFLIDPGTYVYSSNPKQRKKFRSTYMHNSLTVDDYDQNDLNDKDLWYIKRDALPNEILWSTNDNIDIYEGSHTGYKRLQDPVSHIRRFELNKINDNLKIIDKVVGNGKHLIKCHFHFDRGVDVKIIEKVIYCKNKSENIKIRFNLNPKIDFSLDLKKGYISKEYNHKVIAPYVVVAFEIENSVELITVIEN